MLAPRAMIDGAIHLVKRHPVPILGPVVAHALVLAAIPPVPDVLRDPAVALLSLVMLVAAGMAGALAWMLSVRAALDVQPDLGAAWRGVMPQFWAGLGTLLLWWLAVGVGFLLLIVPGVFLLVAWLPIVPVVLAEGRRGPDALKRAWQLTEGHRVSILVVGLQAAVAAVLLSLLRLLPIVGGRLMVVALGLLGGLLAAWVAVFYSRRTLAAP